MKTTKEKNSRPETEKILRNIVSIRKEKGFSQENIADAVNMKQAGYSLIEKGERVLTVDKLFQIAIALEVSVEYLIHYPNEVTLSKEHEPIEAVLQIKLSSDKRNQVLSLVLGDTCLEILNK